MSAGKQIAPFDGAASESQQSPLIDLIIVNYYKARLIFDNIAESLLSDNKNILNIFILDNSCSESEKRILRPLAIFPHIKLIFPDSNLGYCRGCNVSVSLGEADYIVIISPDIRFDNVDGVLSLVARVRGDRGIGIVGPRQINTDGSLEKTIRKFPTLTAQIARRTALRQIHPFKYLVKEYEQPDLDYNQTMDADWLESSCYAMRREVWNELGGFSEKLYIFMGDCDICWRAWEAGYRVVYDPEIEVRADGKRASAGGVRAVFSSWVLRQHLRDTLVYHAARLLRKSPRGVPAGDAPHR